MCDGVNSNLFIKISQVNKITKGWIYEKDLNSEFRKCWSQKRKYLTEITTSVITRTMRKAGR